MSGRLAELVEELDRDALDRSIDIFVLDHDMGGGANRYRRELLANAVARGSNTCCVTWDISSRRYWLELRTGEQHREVECVDGAELLSIGRRLRVQELWLNNLVSFTDPLAFLDVVFALLQQSGARLVLPLHDYFSVCPSFNLIDDRRRSCGVPALDVCRNCLPHVELLLAGQTRERSIDSWRAGWAKLLDGADRIIVFSDISRTLLLRAFPDVPYSKLEFLPHRVQYVAERNFDVNLDMPLRIAAVGELSVAKGGEVVAALFRHLRTRGQEASLIVIGSIPGSDAFGIPATGRYTVENLPGLLQQHGVNVCLVPSIWPETFCYVAEELMALRMPLIVFAGGAPAERVARYGWGCRNR